MNRQVLSAQHISRMCLVCGTDNDAGLHARFLEVEGDEIVCEFIAQEHHQGYPGRLHGGIAATILDETIGRAISISEPDAWYVTVELSAKYRKPVPLGQTIRAVGRITEHGRRSFSGTGEIRLEDGTVAVEATGRYLRLPPERIAEGGLDPLEWKPDTRPLPAEVDI